MITLSEEEATEYRGKAVELAARFTPLYSIELTDDVELSCGDGSTQLLFSSGATIDNTDFEDLTTSC